MSPSIHGFGQDRGHFQDYAIWVVQDPSRRGVVSARSAAGAREIGAERWRLPRFEVAAKLKEDNRKQLYHWADPPWWRPNPDERFRSQERGDDLVGALAWRLRSGEVSHDRVAYAAALGYGPALELGIEPAGIPSRGWDQARGGAILLGQREAVLWAAGVAEDALRKYWTVDDPRPWEAVAAARAWAEDPSEERRREAEAAAESDWSAWGVTEARSASRVSPGAMAWASRAAREAAAALSAAAGAARSAEASAAAAASVRSAWASEAPSSASAAAEAAAWAAAWAAEPAESASPADAAREEAWLLYLGWLAERLCWGSEPGAVKRNPDRRLREASRGEDRASSIAWRLRSGELTEECVRLAAEIGDEDAAQVVPPRTGPPLRRLNLDLFLEAIRCGLPVKEFAASVASVVPGEVGARLAGQFARWVSGENVNIGRVSASAARASNRLSWREAHSASSVWYAIRAARATSSRDAARMLQTMCGATEDAVVAYAAQKGLRDFEALDAELLRQRALLAGFILGEFRPGVSMNPGWKYWLSKGAGWIATGAVADLVMSRFRPFQKALEESVQRGIVEGVKKGSRLVR